MSITHHRTRIRATRANITIPQTLTRLIPTGPRLAMADMVGSTSSLRTIIRSLRTTMLWRRTTLRRTITRC